MKIYVKFYFVSIFFFPLSKRDFIGCLDFTRIAAWNTSSYDVTN